MTRVFVFDVLLVGSAINLVATFVALAMAAKRAPIELAGAVHFSTLPYNVFLFAAVWRNAARAPGLRIGATAWLLVCLLL